MRNFSQGTCHGASSPCCDCGFQASLRLKQTLQDRAAPRPQSPQLQLQHLDCVPKFARQIPPASLLKKTSAWRCAMKHLADPRALVPGTQLVARRRGYVHFGIYVGCGRVVHYAGRLQYPQGLVEEISLPDFAAGRPVYVDSTPEQFTSKEHIVRRARSRLGERSYDVLLNNCEHFSSWCRTGEARSAQVDRLTRRQRLLVRAIERAILAVTRSVADAVRERRHTNISRSLRSETADGAVTGRVPASSFARVA